MIKNLFLFFWALALFATLSQAQVSSVTGQYLQDNNLLLNPGFESGIGKWTNSAGTFTADYSVFVQGKASGKVVLSSQSLNFFQDSTLFSSQLADGMQAILTVKIKSNVAGVRVCPRQAGSVITSLCVSVQGNDKWGLYQIPFVTGATSQGISINSNGNTISGTVYVDESYVGVSNILNSSSEAKLAGEAYFAGTTSCFWSRTSSTVGAFGATAACPGPTIVRQNLGAWQTTDSDLPRVTVNNLPAGTYKAKFIVRQFMSAVISNPVLSMNDGTTTCEPISVNEASATAVEQTVECSFNYTSAGNRVFEVYGASPSGTISIANSTTSPRASTKFILEYYGSNSTYTTTAGINNVDVFSANISSTGVINSKNVDWLSSCTNVSGVVACTFTTALSNTLTQGMACVGNRAGSSGGTVAVIGGLSTTTGFSFTSGNTTSNATNYTCQKQGADFVATKTITGTFNEVMTAPGIAKPKTCYYAFGGASATLASPTECTTGTCVEVIDTCNSGSPPTRVFTGAYDFVTFATGTFANNSYIHCSCTAFDTTTANPRNCVPQFKTGNQTWSSSSTGSANINLISFDTAGSAQDSYVLLKCEGTSP